MTIANCFTKTVLFMIKDDALHVLVQDGALPTGPALDQDRDLHFATRRVAEAAIGKVDFQILPADTISGKITAPGVPDDLWSVMQLDIGLVRKEGLSEEAEEMFMNIDVAKANLESLDVGYLNICLGMMERMSFRTKWPMFLLNREFTLPEMRRAYEITSGWDIADAAFRRKVLSENIVQEAGTRRGLQTRPATLYSLVGAKMDFEKNLVFTPRA